MNNVRALTAVLLIVIFVLAGREWMLWPDGRVYIRFLDIGQGDSALITLADGKHILIDGGPDWSTLEKLGTYLPFFDRRIDLLILSHPNADHMMSFPQVLRRYDVGALVTSGAAYDSGVYQATLSGASLRGIPLVVLHAGERLEVGEDVLEVLWPPATMPKGMSKNTNNVSLTLRFTHEGKSVLFTGDLESIVEKTLVAARADLHADILKVPHHGSTSSSSTGFLLAVHPDLAVISVGRDNPYGHPKEEILRRLTQLVPRVQRTDESGDIEIVW